MRRLVLALGLLGICGLVGEGAAGDWSAAYLRDNLGTSAGFAALGFAAFSATMTLGRDGRSTPPFRIMHIPIAHPTTAGIPYAHGRQGHHGPDQ